MSAAGLLGPYLVIDAIVDPAAIYLCYKKVKTFWGLSSHTALLTISSASAQHSTILFTQTTPVDGVCCYHIVPQTVHARRRSPPVDKTGLGMHTSLPECI